MCMTICERQPTLSTEHDSDSEGHSTWSILGQPKVDTAGHKIWPATPPPPSCDLFSVIPPQSLCPRTRSHLMPALCLCLGAPILFPWINDLWFTLYWFSTFFFPPQEISNTRRANIHASVVLLTQVATMENFVAHFILYFKFVVYVKEDPIY